MALITCHECKNKLSSEAATCPTCGAPNRWYESPSSRLLKLAGWGALAVVALLAGFLFWGYTLSSTPEGKERSKLRDAIWYCDKEYDRMARNPSTTPGMLVMHRAACEKLKDDFRQRWGREP